MAKTASHSSLSAGRLEVAVCYVPTPFHSRKSRLHVSARTRTIVSDTWQVLLVLEAATTPSIGLKAVVSNSSAAIQSYNVTRHKQRV